MKKVILLAAIASAMVFQNPFDNKSLSAQTKEASSLPVSHSTRNSPGSVARDPAAQTQQSSAASNPATQPSLSVAPPPDVSSVILKEVLSANNQVVSQVASMYQYFGLFITIIVSLVGIFAVALGFFARKSVNAFVQEWGKKLESLDRDMKESLKRLHEAVSMAEASANKAAEHARSIEDSKVVLNKTLEEVDRLRTSVVSLHDQVRGEAVSTAVPPQALEAEAAQPPPEPSGADEDAEVAARLKGKIDSAGEEG